MRRGAAAELSLGHRHQPDRRMPGAEAQREQAWPRLCQSTTTRAPRRCAARSATASVGSTGGVCTRITGASASSRAAAQRPSLRGGAAGGAGEIAPARWPSAAPADPASGADGIAGWSRTAATRLAAGEADQIDARARVGERQGVILHPRAAAEVAEHDDGDVGAGGRHDFAGFAQKCSSSLEAAEPGCSLLGCWLLGPNIQGP